MRRPLLVALPLSLVLTTAAISGPGLFSGEPGPDRSPRDLRATAEQAPPAVAQEEPGAVPANHFGPGPLHKVWIGADDTEAQARVASTGALVRSIDYGRFTLAIVDENAFGGAQALRQSGLRVRDELDLMAFNGIVLDGTRPQEALSKLAENERFTDPRTLAVDPASGLYVVQFEGPVRDDWIAGLDELGVTFKQFAPMNGYVVRLDSGRAAALQSWGQARSYVQYVGAYEPAFRVHEDLREMARKGTVNEAQSVTIQLVNADGVRNAVDSIRAMADEVVSVREVGPYVNVAARVHPVFFLTLAANPAVFQIEPRGQIVALDERQGQIMADNVNATGPSAPGYLSWLASKGFNSSQFGSFAVNVVDDATSLTGHPDVPNSRVAFTLNPTGQTGGQAGHGFLNAHIVAGFNNGTGSAFEDTGGYNYGLGIAPWARVGSTAIFGSGGLDPTSYESSAYSSGARISTNSWSYQTQFGGPVPDYDASSQEYDFIARDAQGGVGGNQEYLVIFSAGNSGSGSNTVSTPSTGKNMITVGAGENNRQTGTDGCGIANSGANNHNDIISFSSRGPVNSSGGDGRWKPELVAPGTHIQAGVPQSNYVGGGVCNSFWPSGQTLYGWSSGTSHSTPAVAGGAALVYQDFLNNGLGTPSPAMMKAVLVNGSEYMTGVGANDTLPSNAQGMGNANLDRSIDGAARVLVDQTQLLTGTGQSYQVTGSIADGGAPFRATLVWTDAPGPTSGAPYVNDLDLTVNVNGTIYRGNVFSGSTSTTGGSYDFRNNTESVFLPAGTTGSFTVTVDASSIGGDGVPGNGDSTDQDFALIVYNGATGPVGPNASFAGSPTAGNAPLSVNFTDTSSGGPTTWSWTFGDGGTSTAQNPSHTYTNPGSYSVTLSITAPGGSDSTTLTNYITVSTPPAPGISDGSFESQTAGTAPTTPWSVDFGSGNIVNPAGGTSADSGMPSDGSNWTEISGVDTNNSSGPSNPGGAGSPPSGGAGISQTFSYGAGSTTLSFDAAFARNESASSTYNDWMSVDITDGSTWYNLYYADTFTSTVGTSSKYGYAITAVSNVSVDLATIFPSSTTSTSFTVTALTGNAVDGVQASIGYVDNFALTGSGPAAPVAGFSGSPTSGPAPLSVNFTDSSTGSITSWAWTFGDGGTSTAQNPSHTYTAAGTYSVSLTVTGPGGSDTLTRTNYVTVNEPPPLAGFSGTPTTGAAPLSVNFTDSSIGAVTSWSWTFGDGGTSTAQSPSHSYTTAGFYTVSLTVTGPGGSDTLTRTNYVVVSDPAPVAAFSGSPTSGIVPLSVGFADASTGAITSWSWTFGDGGTSTAQNPSHTYTAIGTYTVSLTVTGPGGSDTQTRTNYIDVGDVPPPAPTAAFSGSPTSGVAPLSVNFTDASTGSITSWSWTFGDGGTSTAQNPSHSYTAAGTYTVSLTVTGPGGSDTATLTNYVTVSEPAPVASFSGSPTTGNAPLSVNFSDASTGAITSWSWTFGDGGTSTAQNPSHTYTASGTYTVALTVTGPGGSDTATLTDYISVNTPPAPPVAAFSGTPTSGTAPLSVNFTDASTGSITSWSWIFGDGGTSTAQNPSHTYTAAGTYTVSLTVTGPGGSDGQTLTDYITVTGGGGGDPLLYFSFTNNTSVPGVGTVADEDIVSYNTVNGNWALYFDGSDVGIGGTDVVGFHVRANGSILMTFNSSNVSVAGLTGGPSGTTVEDSDIILFTPTSTGSTTAGSFSFYFDGSDVGLTTNGEDVDAIYEFADGSLGVSSLGGLNANGGSGNDEDVMRFTGTFGGSTVGSFLRYWDGSDMGFGGNSAQDVNAITFENDIDLLLSTTGNYTETGVVANDEDAARFSGTFGSATSGTLSLDIDLTSLGISAGEDVDGISYQP